MATTHLSTHHRESAIALYEEVSSRPRTATPRWKQQLAAAKTAWARLSVAELLRSGGREQTLIDLVEERYRVSRVEADRQVQRFIRRQAS